MSQYLLRGTVRLRRVNNEASQDGAKTCGVRLANRQIRMRMQVKAGTDGRVSPVPESLQFPGSEQVLPSKLQAGMMVADSAARVSTCVFIMPRPHQL